MLAGEKQLEGGTRVQAFEPSGLRAALKRATLLKEEDRKLFELLVGGASYRLIARVMGVPAGTVCRRARRIGARLHDPLALALLEEHCPLTPEIRQLGIEHFLAGRSARQIAEVHRMSLGQARSALEFVRGWHKGITQGWRWARGADSERGMR